MDLPNWIVPAIGLVAQAAILYGGYVLTGDRAREAKRIALEAHDKIGLLQSQLSLHRETVARDYISRDVLREFEDRLEKSLERLGERLDRLFDQKRGA